jgi:hypothetical protein
VIESKSVATRIEINEHGEWMRWLGGIARGMPSPVLQAQRQGVFLRDYLQQHCATLLGRSVFGRLQHTFTCMPLDTLVAVSDSAIIDRPKRLPLPEVGKADQVPDRIKRLIADYRKANGLLSFDFSKGGYTFSHEEMARIASFLIEHHRQSPGEMPPSRKPEAVRQKIAPAVPAPVAAPVQDRLTCRHCQRHDLSVQYGRYGYYLKCMACEGNTPIHLTCQACGRRERIRKSGNRFYAECEACGSSCLYHTNPDTARDRRTAAR